MSSQTLDLAFTPISVDAEAIRKLRDVLDDALTRAEGEKVTLEVKPEILAKLSQDSLIFAMAFKQSEEEEAPKPEEEQPTPEEEPVPEEEQPTPEGEPQDK